MKKRNRFGIFTLVLILSLCRCTQDKIPISSSSDVQKEQDTLPEAEITPEEEPFLYGYQNLNEEEKTRYRQILAGIENYEDSVTVEACSEEEINKVSNLVFVDHPEIFWLEQQNYSFNQKENSDVDLLELNLVYNMGKDEIEDTKQQIEAKAEEWSQELSNCENEYDKIKYVYEFLGKNVLYDSESENNQNIQSVFLNQSTVCMGFAKATQYLLVRNGIFCTLVTGKVMPENMEHAWNLVKIGENYYYVDTTWSSSGFVPEEDSIQDFSYTYLCCTAQTLERSHVPDDNLTLPECKDDSYNYYIQNQSWYESYDEAQIYQVLKASILEKREKEDFKFANEEAYQQAVSALAEGNLIEQAVQEFYSFDGENSYRWNVGCSDAELLITVYW